jgi:hypothetical protein
VPSSHPRTVGHSNPPRWSSGAVLRAPLPHEPAIVDRDVPSGEGRNLA